MIAEEAAVTRGAMSFHFHSKEETANAVIDEQHRVARVAAGRALAEAGSAFEGMLRMSASLAEQLRNDVVVSAGIRLTTDGTASQLSATNPYREWMDTMESLTALGIEQGDFHPHLSPRRVGLSIVTSYTGLQLVSDTLTEREDLFERLHDLWSLLITSLLLPERVEANRPLLDVFAIGRR